MQSNSTTKIWFGGQILEGSVAPFDYNDRGLLLGDGLFETMICVNGVVQNLEEHVARMKKSAKFLDIPFSEKEFKSAVKDLSHPTVPLAIRITLTRGSTELGLEGTGNLPTLFGSARSYDISRMFRSVTLSLSGIARNETSPTSQMKTLGYLDSIMALREALTGGFDDAIFLNTKGDVACTSMANIFALYGETLITPPRKDGVLEGTVRKKIIKGVHELDIKIKEMSISHDQLFAADALFITNSLRIIAPVQKISHKNFKSAEHPLVLKMVERCRAINEALVA